MSILTIDTTTIYGTVWCLSTPSPNMTEMWAWNNALDLMQALVYSDHLTIAPVPRLAEVRRQHLADFVEQMGFITKDLKVDKSIFETALKSARQWASKNEKKIAKHLEELRTSPVYSKWLEWNVEAVWPEHCARLGGLTDSSMNSQVAKVTGQSVEVISEINQEVNSLDGLRSLQNGSDTQACELARQLYVASIVVRGGYYSYLAREAKRQFFPHQIREGCRPSIESGDIIPFRRSLAQDYFIGLLVLAAYRPKAVSDRFREFARLANEARFHTSRISLPEMSPSAAKEAAVAAAIKINLDLSSLWARKALDFLEMLLPAWAGTLLGLDPFKSIGSGIIIHVLGKTPPVKSVKDVLINPKWRYENLCGFDPGTVRRFPGGSLVRFSS